MARLLLVNSNREQNPWPAIPIGLCLIASALESAGHEVDLVDLMFAKDPRETLARRLRQRRPDVIGVSVRNIDNCNFEAPQWYLPAVRDDVIAPLRRLAPDLPIVIGGPAVNVAPTAVQRFLGADYALVGEGEDHVATLVADLAAGRVPAPRHGLLGPGESSSLSRCRSALDGGRWSRAYRWLDLRPYMARGAPYPIQTKRGCPLSCSYCLYNEIEGRAYRLRDVTDIADEIEDVSRRGIRQIDFVDSTFNLPKHHALKLCEELARRRLDVEYSTMGLNPLGVTTETVAAMKAAGFTSVMCTPESASDTTLRSLGKNFDRACVERAAAVLRAADLRTFWFFLFGAPGENRQTLRETLDFCESHIDRRDLVLLSCGLRVYQGTPLARHLVEEGRISADDPLIEPFWYTSPDIALETLYELLAESALTHPNIMTNAETRISSRGAWWLKRCFRCLGWRGPFWTHLPRFYALLGLVGARHRTLSQARADLTTRTYPPDRPPE